MATLSDHIRRDAEHAARCEISIELGKYSRRLTEAAKAHIASELANANGGEIDGTAIGREATRLAVTAYIGTGSVQEPVEGEHTAEIEAASPLSGSSEGSGF